MPIARDADFHGARTIDRRPRRTAARRAGAWAAMLAALIVALSAARPAQGQETRWYLIELAGSRAGWTSITRTTRDGEVTTATESRLDIKRGEAVISIAIDSTFVETAGGKPLRFEANVNLGGQPVRTEGTFHDDGIEVRTTQLGRTRTQKHPNPEAQWLPPAAATEFIRQRIAAGAKEIVVHTLEPSQSLEPFAQTFADLQRTTIQVMGKTVEVTRATVTNSAQPGIVTTQFIDAEGIAVRSEANLGGIPMVTVATDRQTAMSPVVAPELMLSTFVSPDRPIRGARRLRSAVYLLSVPEDGGGMPDVPSAGVQRAERVSEHAVRVSINLDEPLPAEPGEADEAEFRTRSTMVDIEDEQVRELHGRAVRGQPADPAARAEAMRRFVFDFIDEKGMGVGFASASEVARHPEGDCSEHATLLAALLRADGIPARVAAGLVYVERMENERDKFGYHMWTQALLTTDGTPRWIDLDPTLPPQIQHDATHIALATTSLRDNEASNPMTGMVSLLGRLKITVEQAGRRP